MVYQNQNINVGGLGKQPVCSEEVSIFFHHLHHGESYLLWMPTLNCINHVMMYVCDVFVRA